MCGCAERRQIGHRMVAAVRRGDYAEARQQMAEMRRSAYQDLGNLTDRVRPSSRPGSGRIMPSG